MYDQLETSTRLHRGGQCVVRIGPRAATAPLPAGRAPGRSRRGVVMLVAMVCLVLVVLLLGALLRLAVTHRRQVRHEQIRLQADWLAEAAVERAVHRLNTDGDYEGETWTFTAAQLGGGQAGEATIRVNAVQENPEVRQIVVRATYPTATHRFATRTKQILAKVSASDY